MTQAALVTCCGVAPKVYRRGRGDHCFYGIICPICREEVRARRGDTAVALWHGSMARREKANTKLIDDTETKLEAMTQERDSLRREVEALVYRVAKVDCPKTPMCSSDEVGVKCRECWTAWAKQQAAQAGKGEG